MTNREKFARQRELLKELRPSEAYEQAWGEPLIVDYTNKELVYRWLCPAYRKAIDSGAARLIRHSSGHWYFTVIHGAAMHEIYQAFKRKEWHEALEERRDA